MITIMNCASIASITLSQRCYFGHNNSFMIPNDYVESTNLCSPNLESVLEGGAEDLRREEAREAGLPTVKLRPAPFNSTKLLYKLKL